MNNIVWLAVIAVVLAGASVGLVFFLPWLALVLGQCALVAAVLSLRE